MGNESDLVRPKLVDDPSGFCDALRPHEHHRNFPHLVRHCAVQDDGHRDTAVPQFPRHLREEHVQDDGHQDTAVPHFHLRKARCYTL